MHTSEEEQQQGDTVALNMGSVPFSACVLMAHCSSCSSLNISSLLCALSDASQTVYHQVSLYTRVFLSWLIHISPHQTGATLLPVSLMGVMSAGENHIIPEIVALENWTWLELLGMVVVFHFQSVTPHLPSAWQLLWWLYLHTAPAAHSWCRCSYICCHNMADIAQK